MLWVTRDDFTSYRVWCECTLMSLCEAGRRSFVQPDWHVWFSPVCRSPFGSLCFGFQFPWIKSAGSPLPQLFCNPLTILINVREPGLLIDPRVSGPPRSRSVFRLFTVKPFKGRGAASWQLNQFKAGGSGQYANHGMIKYGRNWTLTQQNVCIRWVQKLSCMGQTRTKGGVQVSAHIHPL